MTFRYARHTDNLESLKWFYTEVLRLELLGSFQGHHGFDGIFIGRGFTDWHLEFTSTNEFVEKKFDENNPLVFYVSSQLELDSIKKIIKMNNIAVLEHPNPYWSKHNAVFIKDPDGFPIIVLFKLAK